MAVFLIASKAFSLSNPSMPFTMASATTGIPGLPTMQSVSLPHRCHTGRRPCSSAIASIVRTMSGIRSGCRIVISGIAAR